MAAEQESVEACRAVSILRMSSFLLLFAFSLHELPYFLVLRSLKAITKEAAIVAMILGRSTPDPRFGSPVELSGRDARGLLNLIRVGKALSSQGIAAEEAPPALLQVKPAGAFGNEDLMEPRMLRQPGAGLGTVVAGEVVSDDEDVTRRIVGFDVSEQGNVVRRVTRGGALGQFLAIAYAQRSIDPGFLGAATVIHERFDAVPIGRPAGRRREGAWHYWPEFVGADGNGKIYRFPASYKGEYAICFMRKIVLSAPT